MSDNPVPGWYKDPNRPNDRRWWDGDAWTQHFREFRPDVAFDSTPPAQASPDTPSTAPVTASNYEPNLLDRYVRALKQQVWLRWVSGIVVLILIFGVLGSNSETPESDPAASSQPASAPAPAPEDTASSEGAASNEPPADPAPAEPKKLSTKERVTAALDEIDGTVQTPVINDVDFGSDALTVTVATPEGGLEGASTRDLNEQAAAIFKAVYGEAKYKKTDTVVVFEGGLVSTKTGKDLEDVNTGIFTMPRSDARDIDWSDEDTVKFIIDWTLYRDFAHPALKQDD